MPWVPELFSAPVLARFEAKQKRTVVDVPYFEGLLAGDTDALVESFAGEPRLHHPLRGRIEGEHEFREFVADTDRWLREREATVEDVQRSVLPDRGFEEVVVHLRTPDGHVDLPHAMVADHTPEGRIEEIRVYFGTRPLTGHPTERAPLLQVDPKLHEQGPVEYVGALATGDAAIVAAAFEADGRAREPGGAGLIHSGADLRDFYARRLDGEGIELEPCVLIEDGETCAFEYNARRGGSGSWRAGLTVFVSGNDGKLAAARIYTEL
jgi:ketosteroid isomerase-like protein